MSQQKVESNVRLGPYIHGAGDWEEILLVEKIALEDEGVKAEIAKLGLPEDTVVIGDPWIYGMRTLPSESHSNVSLSIGSDGNNDERRMYQCFLYMRDPRNPGNLDSNHYAFPLAISPVVDCVEQKVIRIDICPTGEGLETKSTQPIPIPEANDYTPEHQKSLRTDLKPLNVVQPEGASFKVTQVGETGQVIEWQKWSFRVGFNQREGMVLYDVCRKRILEASSMLSVLGPI